MTGGLIKPPDTFPYSQTPKPLHLAVPATVAVSSASHDYFRGEAR